MTDCPLPCWGLRRQRTRLQENVQRVPCPGKLFNPTMPQSDKKSWTINSCFQWKPPALVLRWPFDDHLQLPTSRVAATRLAYTDTHSISLRSLAARAVPNRYHGRHISYNVEPSPYPAHHFQYPVCRQASRPGEEPWAVRCPRLCAQLRFITSGSASAFMCFQEVLYSQLLDIQASLGPSWSCIGRGREDGEKAGEFSPIFFRTDWTCERETTFWLSETPYVPSKGWDASLPRIVTMGSFRHKKTAATVTTYATLYPTIRNTETGK